MVKQVYRTDAKNKEGFDHIYNNSVYLKEHRNYRIFESRAIMTSWMETFDWVHMDPRNRMAALQAAAAFVEAYPLTMMIASDEPTEPGPGL